MDAGTAFLECRKEMALKYLDIKSFFGGFERGSFRQKLEPTQEDTHLLALMFSDEREISQKDAEHGH
jgi:hypothetical protein